jgi:hypothetical protein
VAERVVVAMVGGGATVMEVARAVVATERAVVVVATERAAVVTGMKAVRPS